MTEKEEVQDELLFRLSVAIANGEHKEVTELSKIYEKLSRGW